MDSWMIRGKVWKFGDGVNTDVIFPGKYTYTLKAPEEIAAHALEDLDPEFTRNAGAGDIIVAGRNWGNGSSREQAVTTLKFRGISAIVAKSFARIYFRNGINQGLLLVTCPELVDAVQGGEEIAIDALGNCIYLGDRIFSFPPLSEQVLEMLHAGGLVPYLRNKLGLSSSKPIDSGGE
jgi:3-isopropylmalate/(R)-2-methylmalate dehydratase small subunit